MSRVGNSPIIIPEGVNVSIQDQKVIVKGKLGDLVQKVNSLIKVVINENVITCWSKILKNIKNSKLIINVLTISIN